MTTEFNIREANLLGPLCPLPECSRLRPALDLLATPPATDHPGTMRAAAVEEAR